MNNVSKLIPKTKIELNLGTTELLEVVIGTTSSEETDEKLQKTLALKLQEAIEITPLIQPEPTQTLLDLGSGFGVLAKHLAQTASKVICCDIYRDMLDFASHLNQAQSNIEYVHIGNYDLSPIAENSIDTIYSTGLFIHFNIYDTNLYLKEFARIIKDGGKLIFNIKNENALEMSQFFHDADIYTKNGNKTLGLQQWMSPQGVVQLAEHYGFTLTNPLNTSTDVWFSFVHKK